MRPQENIPVQQTRQYNVRTDNRKKPKNINKFINKKKQCQFVIHSRRLVVCQRRNFLSPFPRYFTLSPVYNYTLHVDVEFTYFENIEIFH